MTAYEKLKAARSADRPTAAAYISNLFTEVTELHGDRRFGDDSAIIGGVGRLGGIPVTFIGTERGTNLEERISRSFGCPRPEGYRKAMRLMQQAEKFGRPVITFIDTSGAYCGADAEERGQGLAIAENLTLMAGLMVPVIAVIIGEGESGGALGIGVADRVLMLENAVYSVISPEGCASILWKDASRAEQMALNLRITSEDMKEFGVADAIVAENFDRFGSMCSSLRKLLKREITELSALSTEELTNRRYQRFRKLGVFSVESEEI